MNTKAQHKLEFPPHHVTMTGYTTFKENLIAADDMIDGLQIIRDFLRPYGVGDLLYGFMLHAKSHVRNEQLLISTFPRDIRKTFIKDGGTMSYKFGDMLPTMTKPVYYDLLAALKPDNHLFSYNRGAKMSVEYGYKHGWIVPILSKGLSGFGFMMMFQNSDPNAVQIDVEKLKQFGLVYHMNMRSHKQMASHFGLTDKQRIALYSAAKGQTAADLALRLGLAERTIELRLQEARQKLKARTTSEAVYKALAYLILPYHNGKEG